MPRQLFIPFRLKYRLDPALAPIGEAREGSDSVQCVQEVFLIEVGHLAELLLATTRREPATAMLLPAAGLKEHVAPEQLIPIATSLCNESNNRGAIDSSVGEHALKTNLAV